MLTEEQIKALKPGDIIDIRGFVNLPLNNGNILAELRYEFDNRILPAYQRISTEFISLPSEQEVPTPKYDPTRPFKKGDRAQAVERNGRTLTCFPAGRIKVGDIVTVAEDEAGDVFIKVLTEDGHEMMVPWFMLELITPVEEQEPYYIESETFDYEIRNANDDPDIGTSLAFHIMFQDPDESEILRVKSYYESYVYSREHAEADAEAECKRLNEEYRKNQNND